MARARILKTVAVIAAILALGYVCSRPEKGPTIRGRLTDERTGKPISDARIFVYYELYENIPLGGTRDRGQRQATTDADGRFLVEGEIFPGFSRALWRSYAHFTWIHPDYGWGRSNTTAGVYFDMRVTPQSEKIERLRSAKASPYSFENPCADLRITDACDAYLESLRRN